MTFPAFQLVAGVERPPRFDRARDRHCATEWELGFDKSRGACFFTSSILQRRRRHERDPQRQPPLFHVPASDTHTCLAGWNEYVTYWQNTRPSLHCAPNSFANRRSHAKLTKHWFIAYCRSLRRSIL